MFGENDMLVMNTWKSSRLFITCDTAIPMILHMHYNNFNRNIILKQKVIIGFERCPEADVNDARANGFEMCPDFVGAKNKEKKGLETMRMRIMDYDTIEAMNS